MQQEGKIRTLGLECRRELSPGRDLHSVHILYLFFVQQLKYLARQGSGRAGRRNAGEGAFARQRCPGSQPIPWLLATLPAIWRPAACHVVFHIKCQMSNVPYQCTYQIPWLTTLLAIGGWQKPCHGTHKMSNTKNFKNPKFYNCYILNAWLPLLTIGNHVIEGHFNHFSSKRTLLNEGKQEKYSTYGSQDVWTHRLPGSQHRPHHDSLFAPPIPCWPFYGEDNCSQHPLWLCKHWPPRASTLLFLAETLPTNSSFT